MRLQAIETAGFITREERLVLAPTGGGPLPRLENLCTLLPLGLSLAPNFRINGRDRVVPMVTEEASVVAGASRIAVLLRSGEGLRATAGERLLGGQVLWAWQGSWQDLAALTEPRQGELLERLNGLHPSLVGAGGGLRSFCWRAGPEAGLQVLDLVAHTGDAMGAHLLDRLAAELAGELLRFLPGRPVTSIVSNRPLGRSARAEARVSLELLGRCGREGAQVGADIETLCGWALGDASRWPTHLKGALNGAFAVLRAFGQDDRAVAAALLSTAQVEAPALLPRWRVQDGELVGQLAMPLAVGVVGVGLEAPPGSILARLAGVVKASDLEELVVAVGLAQNLAALQTLVTEGIVKGHGELHARRGRGQGES
jgi:hydroxymethylglutaryl-CoA reductase